MKFFIKIFILIFVCNARIQATPSCYPFAYQHPFCIPGLADDELDASRAGANSSSSNPTAGFLNGQGQAVDFNYATSTVIVSGYASQYNPANSSGAQFVAGTQLTYDMIAVGRYNYLTGAPDPTFNPQGLGINGIGQGAVGQVITDLGSTSRAVKIVLQKNPTTGVLQLIYVVGYVYRIATGSSANVSSTTSDNLWRICVVCYLPDGSLNPNFNPQGTGLPVGPGLPKYGVIIDSSSNVSDQGLAIALQPDNKILVTGQSSGQLFVVRYLPNGSLDTTFNPSGYPDTGNPSIFPANGVQGRQIIPGAFVCAVVGYPTQTNTGPNSIGADIGFGIAIQKVGPNAGKIVVAGTGITQQGYSALIMIRLNPNGTLDKTFGPQTTLQVYPGQIKQVAPTPQVTQQIGTTGNQSSSSSQLVQQIGKVVTPIQGYDDRGLAIALQPDDSILVAGTTQDPLTYIYGFCVVRYTPNGKVDTTFGPLVGPQRAPFFGVLVNTGSTVLAPGKIKLEITGAISATATAVLVQSDGGIVLTGYNNYAPGVQNSQQTFCIARYKPNGYLDTATFNPSGVNPTAAPPLYIPVDQTGRIQPGVKTVSIQGFNDKSFGAALQPVTLPLYPNQQIFTVGSSLSYNYFQQYYAFAFIRLDRNGTVNASVTDSFTYQ